MIIPISHLRKLRFTEINDLTQDHTANQWGAGLWIQVHLRPKPRQPFKRTQFTDPLLAALCLFPITTCRHFYSQLSILIENPL